MSEIIMLFTVLLLSKGDLKLIHETYNLRHQKSLEIKEYVFPNHKSGFQEMSRKMEELKNGEPSRECLFDLSEDDGGFLGSMASLEKKPKMTNHIELSSLCRKKKTK